MVHLIETIVQSQKFLVHYPCLLLHYIQNNPKITQLRQFCHLLLPQVSKLVSPQIM